MVLFTIFFTIFISCKKKNSQLSVDNSVDVVNVETTIDTVEFTRDTVPLILTDQLIALSSGDSFRLRLPNGFRITPVVEGLRRPRFFATAPDGRIFLTTMYNLTDNRKGQVLILEDFNETTRRFETIRTWRDGLRNPNSVAFYTDPEDRSWLYLAVTDSLVRYPYTPGETSPSGPGQAIHHFPGEGFSYKYGGWHLTRTIAIHEDKVYVSVGSSCNLCEESPDEPGRAAVLRMNPDGSEVEVFARGLRNAVDIGFVDGQLYGTNMASDHHGPYEPNDHFYRIEKGKHYGWPYCYEHEGNISAEDPTAQSENRKAGKLVKTAWERKTIDCEEVPHAYALFESHGSPLGFAHFPENKNIPELGGYFLAALHGMTRPKENIPVGHELVRFTEDHRPETFLTGFFQNGTQHGRPCGIHPRDEHSFFLSDDHKGVIYLIEREQND